MNHNYTYVPENVDIEAMAKSAPANANVSADQVAFLIGNYLESAAKRRDELMEHGSITMNAELLVKYFRNYSYGMEAISNAGVFLTTGGYQSGAKSRSYSLAPEYTTSVTQYDFQDPHFKYLLQKKLKNHERQKEKQLIGYKYLKKWYDPKYLYFDKEYALELAKELSCNKPELLPIYETSVHRFAEVTSEDRWFTVDSAAGRFHSPLTNLKSEFRSAMRFINPITGNTERLYSIDITNSQPYLSQLLLNTAFYIHKLPHIPTLHSYIPSIPPYIKTIMFAKTEQTLVPQDLQQFIEDVNSGMFYEQFSALVHEKHPELDFSRKEAKVAIYQTFFSDNRFIGRSSVPKWDATPKTCFKEQYPTVYEIFRQIKKKNAAALAITLQRIESFLMIETVARRITKERPECPIYTIHDSIATTMEHVVYVKQVISEEFTKFVCVPPKLDVKGW